MKKRSGGFTMTELIMVMVIVGVLAAFMLPRLSGGADTEGKAYADRIVATLRLAQKTAVAQRRLVCVTTAPTAFALAVAKDNPVPADGCKAGLTATGDTGAATSDATVSATGTPAGLVGGTLYFQPNGDITTDIGGATAATGTITVNAASGKVRDIRLEGATGYVD